VGALSVTGTGSAGTGGTIQNTTGSGIQATNTRSLTLSFMNMANANTTDGAAQGAGCDTSNVSLCNGSIDLTTISNGVSLSTISISGGNEMGIVGSGIVGLNVGNASSGECGVHFLGLTGNVSVTNSSFTGNAFNQFSVGNSSGSLTFTATGSTFSDPTNTTSGDGLGLSISGNASLTASVTGNTFARNGDDHFNVTASGSAGGSVTFQNNTMTGANPASVGQTIAVRAGGGWSGNLFYDINGNSITGAIAVAINTGIAATTSSALLHGHIRNNIVGTAGVVNSGSAQGQCIMVEANGTGDGTHTSSVTGNTVRRCFDRGIYVLGSRDGNNNVNATISTNNISELLDVNSRNAIMIETGSSLLTETGTVCADILNNTMITANTTPDEMRIRQRSPSTVRLPGYSGGAADDTAVEAYLVARNVAAAGLSADVTHTAAGPFLNTVPAGSQCSQP
jgi:hypothetical protein